MIRWLINVERQIEWELSAPPKIPLLDISSNPSHHDGSRKYINIHNLHNEMLQKKAAIFWDIALYRQCVNRRFGGTYNLHLQDLKSVEQKTRALAGARWYVPPKHRFIYGLYGTILHKMATCVNYHCLNIRIFNYVSNYFEEQKNTNNYS
jgi:hypothetical protein